jgi:transposase
VEHRQHSGPAEGRRVLIDDPARFDDVQVIGVDEQVWRHTRRGDKYVTVIIDLTPIRDRTGPARLLDMVEGRSKQVFKTWLATRPQAWRDQFEVVAMNGFTGFKTATTEELPDAAAVMDPFHVVRLAGDALDRCRRRTQQDLHGHRGRATDPLYRARRVLHTGTDLLTDKQRARLDALLTRRAGDILAYFDRPGTSNGPTEAINGRLEHLRGTALGFRNLTNYVARSLLETGGFRPQLHRRL